MEREGLSAALTAQAARGRPLVGICGGMQMLGREVADPEGMEGGGTRSGLGLLGLRTVLGREKITVRVRATFEGPALFGQPLARATLDGYEIHLGATAYDPGTLPLFHIRRERECTAVADGARDAAGTVIGTYLHGLFDSDVFRHGMLRALRAAAGLAPPAALVPHTAEREQRLDAWADHVRAALDIESIERWIR
jgi:adenosylcobyric acid synthase